MRVKDTETPLTPGIHIHRTWWVRATHSIGWAVTLFTRTEPYRMSAWWFPVPIDLVALGEWDWLQLRSIYIKVEGMSQELHWLSGCMLVTSYGTWNETVVWVNDMVSNYRVSLMVSSPPLGWLSDWMPLGSMPIEYGGERARQFTDQLSHSYHPALGMRLSLVASVRPIGLAAPYQSNMGRKSQALHCFSGHTLYMPELEFLSVELICPPFSMGLVASTSMALVAYGEQDCMQQWPG